MRLFRRTPKLAEPLPAEVEVIVVGTEYYSPAARLRPGRPVEDVTVEPDPGNRHDPNAVAVRWKGELIGYLSGARAKKYRPLVTGRHPVEAATKAVPGTRDLKLFVYLPCVRVGRGSDG